jgi:hypothetical protein
MGYNDKSHKGLLVARGAGERPAKSSAHQPCVYASRLLSPEESLHPPCLHLLTKVPTVPGAGDDPQARSVPAATVPLGQDRLSGCWGPVQFV